MAETLKILAQSKPSATTLTDAYSVPNGTQATISAITICNQSATPTTYRISVSVQGTADTAKQYLFYDVAIAGNASDTVVIGITLGNNDVVRVYNTLATLSFNIFGVEIT